MRRPRPFKLERYFGDKEHRARFLLSSSDCETMGLGELLGAADSGSLAMWEGLRLGYTEPMGHPALRDEVAALYPGLGPGNVLLISPGEGILLAFAALLEAGDHVIVTYPAYQSLFEIPAAMGCSVTLWRLEPGNGRWALDLDFLERSIRSNTKLVVVNFPHNPTGFHPSREEYGRVLDIVRRRGLYLFFLHLYDVTHRINGQPDPFPADFHHDGPPVREAFGSFDIESPAEVHDRYHLAAEIYHSHDKIGGFRKPCHLRELEDFLNREDFKAILFPSYLEAHDLDGIESTRFLFHVCSRSNLMISRPDAV